MPSSKTGTHALYDSHDGNSSWRCIEKIQAQTRNRTPQSIAALLT